MSPSGAVTLVSGVLSQSLGTPMWIPITTRPLPGTWKPPGAFPATGGDGALSSHWEQQENSLWVAEAHTSPCPPVPCFRKGQICFGGTRGIACDGAEQDLPLWLWLGCGVQAQS